MTFDEFLKNLSVEQRVSFINDTIKQQGNLTKACKFLNFDIADVRDIFKISNYSYNKDTKRYVLMNTSTEPSTQINGSVHKSTSAKDSVHKLIQTKDTVHNDTQTYKTVPKDTVQYVTIEQFNQLQAEVQAIKNILNSKSLNTDMLDIEEVKLSVSKTLRLSPLALQRLEDFCKAFPQYSKHTILSHIINTFIDNFENKQQ